MLQVLTEIDLPTFFLGVILHEECFVTHTVMLCGKLFQ
jgi:hypothetical protein